MKKTILATALCLLAGYVAASPDDGLAAMQKYYKFNPSVIEARAEPTLFKGLYGIPLRAGGYTRFFNESATMVFNDADGNKWEKLQAFKKVNDPDNLVPKASYPDLYKNLVQSIDLAQAPIVATFGKPGPVYVLVTAHDCPFARKLVENLKRVESKLNLTLAIFPTSLRSETRPMAKALACSRSARAWYDTMLGRPVQLKTPSADCVYDPNKVADMREILSATKGIDKTGTPYIIMPDGVIATGPTATQSDAEIINFFTFNPQRSPMIGVGMIDSINDGRPNLLTGAAPWK
ncbi:hypothetical protein ABHF33_07140 [Chitinibacter sp. FCG-7]|uniref:Thioredoxin-like fold domain-containing protein n=1 Tax=Chitinibacter mangrovi TaxID=3153927 RepID=A0AAU7FEG4_9NEIS